jgi:hypothetical protein
LKQPSKSYDTVWKYSTSFGKPRHIFCGTQSSAEALLWIRFRLKAAEALLGIRFRLKAAEALDPIPSQFVLELVAEVRDSVFQSQSDWSLLPTAPLVPNFVGSVDAPPRGSSVVIIFVMPASQVGFEERSNGGEVRRKHDLMHSLQFCYSRVTEAPSRLDQHRFSYGILGSSV